MARSIKKQNAFEVLVSYGATLPSLKKYFGLSDTTIRNYKGNKNLFKKPAKKKTNQYESIKILFHTLSRVKEMGYDEPFEIVGHLRSKKNCSVLEIIRDNSLNSLTEDYVIEVVESNLKDLNISSPLDSFIEKYKKLDDETMKHASDSCPEDLIAIYKYSETKPYVKGECLMALAEGKNKASYINVVLSSIKDTSPFIREAGYNALFEYYGYENIYEDSEIRNILTLGSSLEKSPGVLKTINNIIEDLH